jgi:hypothetical protein
MGGRVLSSNRRHSGRSPEWPWRRTSRSTWAPSRSR